MSTQNPFIDTIIDAQKKVVTNWVDTTKKFQEAFSGGNIQSESQSIYNEWLEKQMSIFSGTHAEFGKNLNGSENHSKPEEFFQKWYNQQAANLKQMTDFNQSIYNSFVNYGKNPQEYASNFATMNSAWTSVYNTWMNALNSSFETMKKNIPDAMNQEMFKKLFEGNKAYVQLQELWSPVFKAMQNNEFSMEKLKGLMNMESYKKISEQMFAPFMSNAGMTEVFDMATKNMQSFFQNNNQLWKEYTNAIQLLSQKYPQLISGDFAKLSDLFNQMNDVFGKTFSPVINLMTSAKEKEQVEAMVNLMDKVAEFSVRQTQLQHHFYTTSQKAMEQAAKTVASKWNNTLSENQSFNEFYNEWIKVNEAAFTELYKSEEFSKLKSDVLSAGADVKLSFEKQFEIGRAHV